MFGEWPNLNLCEKQNLVRSLVKGGEIYILLKSSLLHFKTDRTTADL